MLLKSYPSITLQDNQWTNLNTLFGIPTGTGIVVSNSGNVGCYIYVNSIEPTSESDGVLINRVSDTTQKTTVADGSETVWVRGKGSRLNVNLVGFSTGEPAPSGLYEGTRAITVQGYVEANVKNGVEHEGSTLITLAPNGNNDTIFLTGTKPVILKGRKVSYDGDGITAEIFVNPTYTGGTSVSYQNANGINPVAGESQILVGALVSDEGTLAFSPTHSLGNTGFFGGGSQVPSIESEHILSPNTTYLFRLTSLDTGTAQQVASHLSWYEGELDLPLV